MKMGNKALGGWEKNLPTAVRDEREHILKEGSEAQ